MLKYILFISAIFITTSCSLSGENKDAPVVDNTIPVVMSGSRLSTGSSLPPGTQIIALSGSKMMDAIPVTPDVNRMIDIEKQGGSTGVLAADCNSFDKSGKEYCLLQKEKIEFAIKTSITWEGSIKKGGEFISTMDCKTIYSEVGQKYCQEYQAGLKKK